MMKMTQACSAISALLPSPAAPSSPRGHCSPRWGRPPRPGALVLELLRPALRP